MMPIMPKKEIKILSLSLSRCNEGWATKSQPQFRNLTSSSIGNNTGSINPLDDIISSSAWEALTQEHEQGCRSCDCIWKKSPDPLGGLTMVNSGPSYILEGKNNNNSTNNNKEGTTTVATPARATAGLSLSKKPIPSWDPKEERERFSFSTTI